MFTNNIIVKHNTAGFASSARCSGRDFTRLYVYTCPYAQVTGAGRGLGREMSLQLAKEGAKLVCVDINAEGVKETADTINAGRTGKDAVADYYTTNVAEPSQVNELAKTVEEKWGKVDVLINNAGIVASAPLMDTSDDQIKRMIDVNLVSHFWVSI